MKIALLKYACAGLVLGMVMGPAVEVVKAVVNFDTAWTFVYDGGKDSAGVKIYQDEFYDIACLASGEYVCVGSTGYSSTMALLCRLTPAGTLALKKTYRPSYSTAEFNSQWAHSIFKARNGDFLIAGARYWAPWVMRVDSAGNEKWSAWYFDTSQGILGSLLSGSGTINSVLETSRGKIVCAAGDEYPNNRGFPLTNNAIYLEFDSTGRYKRSRQWYNTAGYNMGGFYISETKEGNFLLSGNQCVLFLDTIGVIKWKTSYTFQLSGVGSETNNINRAKVLRDGTFLVAGQAYEGNCWTSYQRLYYDAWWTPIGPGGNPVTWDTAGDQGGNDIIYDFAQLRSGDLVFVGCESSKSGDHGGLWTFMTDSTGKKMLWEKLVKIPYGTDYGNWVSPLSVCATPDSGFTVAGYIPCGDGNGGNNAFAAHFVPQAISAVSSPSVTSLISQTLKTTIAGKKVFFTVSNSLVSPIRVTVCNAAGRTVARLVKTGGTGSPLTWDVSHAGRGVYLYCVNSADDRISGTIIIGGDQ